MCLACPTIGVKPKSILTHAQLAACLDTYGAVVHKGMLPFTPVAKSERLRGPKNGVLCRIALGELCKKVPSIIDAKCHGAWAMSLMIAVASVCCNIAIVIHNAVTGCVWKFVPKNEKTVCMILRDRHFTLATSWPGPRRSRNQTCTPSVSGGAGEETHDDDDDDDDTDDTDDLELLAMGPVQFS